MSSYNYWQHFLALESDFATTSRFVEFTSENYDTYSIEYAKLLMAVCSEIDVLCKIICDKLDSSAPSKNINDYRACLTSHTQIANEEVLIRRYNFTLKPWENWLTETTPSWWKSYNDVKHQRNIHFQKANLENCLNAISALFVVVLYCHKAESSEAKLEPAPVLLGRNSEPSVLAIVSGYTLPEFS